MSESAIRVTGVRKKYRDGAQALDGLNLNVPRGVVYGLIGRNGAGKTTLLRTLMGLLRADRGEALILERDFWTASALERTVAAYVPQALKIHTWMTTGELCEYASHFYPEWDHRYARELAERFETPWEQPVASLSGGEQRKASLVAAFAARTDVLLLDEPAAGLDPIARRRLIDEIVEVISDRPECTVIVSTHIISDLERLAEVIGVMSDGVMTLESRVDDLQSSIRRVQIIFDDAPPPDLTIPNAIRFEIDGPVVTAVVRDAHSLLGRWRGQDGVRVNEFPIGLEDAVIELLGRKAPSRESE
ncbi:MAG: ATP-binding cassette domain-containing protein [bacterium]|nr:ATP-binding cassette domain-containing protein [bacterium]